jgi:hypothetical protein
MGLDFLCLNAYRVFARLDGASRSICVHLGKLSTEQEDLG